MKDQTTTHL